MLNNLPNVHTTDTGQCFPLKVYQNTIESSESLFTGKSERSNYDEKDNITNNTLISFKKVYSDDRITKEDIFYYIYGPPSL